MIVKFSEIQKPNSDNTDLNGWVVVRGTPTMETKILHTNREKNMVSGIWKATVGTYHATYSAYEFVHMISGKITITPDDGSPSTVVRGGDTFVVESNFKGTWKIEEDVTKHFDFML
jgi:hypothetical protein